MSSRTTGRFGGRRIASVAALVALGAILVGAPAAATPVAPSAPFASSASSASEAAQRLRRIVGGVEATPGDWPWMAAIVTTGGDPFFAQFCSGSLVRDTWILTAAHCFFGVEVTQQLFAEDVEVILGLHDLVADPGQRFAVRTLVVHPDYVPETDDNDIALLELEAPSSALTIAFEDADVTADLEAGELLSAIGWGDTAPTGDPPSFPTALQEVELPYIPTATCASEPPYVGLVTPNMFCAGFALGGKDTCQGDSGGPVMIQVGGAWQLVGLPSWGFGCALPERPGVLTRVANYIDWAVAIVPEPASSTALATVVTAIAALRRRGPRGRRPTG